MNLSMLRFHTPLIRILLIAVFSLLLPSLLGCSDTNEETTLYTFQPSGLETVLIEQKSVDDEIFFDGALEALHQSTVASETNARVIEVPFDVDDTVAEGQVIVRFRDTDQRASLSKAEAALSESEAQFTNAEVEYDRAQKVFARQLISEAEMDNVLAAFDSAQARVRAAKAELNRAREQLEHTVIRAPFAGVVVKRHIEVGETATVGQPLMTGLSLEHLRAKVNIPQYHIAPLRQHRRARIILPDGKSVTAANLRIPPSADMASHSFEVLVDLPAENLGIFPGTLVKVAFVRGQLERLVVPENTLVRRGEVTGLYIIDGDERITFRYVRTANRTSEQMVALVSGAYAGERVAIDSVAAAIQYKKQFSSTGDAMQ